jgi:hypothetical protein
MAAAPRSCLRPTNTVDGLSARRVPFVHATHYFDVTAPQLVRTVRSVHEIDRFTDAGVDCVRFTQYGSAGWALTMGRAARGLS